MRNQSRRRLLANWSAQKSTRTPCFSSWLAAQTGQMRVSSPPCGIALRGAPNMCIKTSNSCILDISAMHPEDPPINPQTLSAILEQIREFYVARLIEAIKDRPAGPGEEVAHEVAFRGEDGEFITEGLLDTPIRGDLFVIKNNEVIDVPDVDSDVIVQFDPVFFDWPESALKVDFHPFQWDWLQIQIHGLEGETDWSPLREWFMRWFDEDDPAEDELLEGTHFMSDPMKGDGFYQFSIDLGSAPCDAFEDLIDAVVELGATRVEVGQFDELEG